MRILKVFSALLSYPRGEMRAALDELAEAVANEPALPERERVGVLALLDRYRDVDLIEWQQDYVELFDRGRHLSLHLFEHIHGESRDRGQAMVDLLRVYQTHGFELSARELPDYIPLFLEYLAQQPAGEALDLLRGALPVLNRLGARLAERNSPYAALFDALTAVAGEHPDNAALRQQVAAEGPDETLVRMDEIWEEEAVRFMANPGACEGQPQDVQPVNFAPRRDPVPTRPTL